MQALKSEFPSLTTIFTGHNKVKVKVLGRYLIKSDIKKSIDIYLDEKFNKRYKKERLFLKFLQISNLDKILYKNYTYDFSFLDKELSMPVESFNRRNSGTKNHKLFISDQGKNSYFLNLKMQIELQVHMPKTSRQLEPGDSLSGSDFYMSWVRKTDDFNKRYMSDLNKINSFSVKQRISKNNLVLRSQIGKETLVNRGDYITMSINRGRLQVSSKVKALKSGGMGDVIPVYYANTKKTLQAQIQGYEFVKVLK